MEAFVIIFFSLMVLFILSGLRMDREYERGVIFRLGRFQSVKGPGLYWVMQMISEVGVEHNTTTIILMPSDFVTLAKNLAAKVPQPQNAN